MSLELAQNLIRQRSISGETDQGALNILQKELETLGFTCYRLPFSEEGTYDVDNLYAVYGDKGQNLCFAGHTDVVSPGDESSWTHPPFAAEVHDGILYGRGAVDMKSSIAAMITATKTFLKNNPNFDQRISFLITGDEEAAAINGTDKVLNWMAENDHKIDFCVVGEPTSEETLGDIIKHGRRGSLNCFLTVNGIQGHAAYPHKADNPVTKLVEILHVLQNTHLDDGTSDFQPSNLEVTGIDAYNKTTNTIPEKAEAILNIRLNTHQTNAALRTWITETCHKVTKNIDVRFANDSDAFLTEPGRLTQILQDAVHDVTATKAELSTGGGTSDARFIKNHVSEGVIELGPRNETAHKIDEHVPVADLENLSKIYQKVLEKYFTVQPSQ